MMMKHSLFLAQLLPAASAMAGQSEHNFAKKGNPLTGTTYTTSVSLANLSVDSAIGQMRGVAIKRNMDVLSEDARGGTMLIEERENALRKPLPMTIEARRTTIAVALRHGTLVRCARRFMTIMATSYGVRRHLQAFIWSVVGHCRTVITANAWTTAR